MECKYSGNGPAAISNSIVITSKIIRQNTMPIKDRPVSMISLEKMNELPPMMEARELEQ
ncbi:MAG: hypothetical protein HPY66_0602 [Firmicutes bacterium]|nr:hypothetical protein [Bacillota bacterium]